MRQLQSKMDTFDLKDDLSIDFSAGSSDVSELDTGSSALSNLELDVIKKYIIKISNLINV